MGPLETDIVLRIVVAALLGAVLGLERSIVGKHAGLRTYALVSLGSALFVIISIMSAYQFMALYPGLNPFVIAGNVVLGIGFLGTGLAIFKGEHPELTTAAGLWVAAAVGMAAGFGYYLLAITASILSVLIFSILLKAENRLRARYGNHDQ